MPFMTDVMSYVLSPSPYDFPFPPSTGKEIYSQVAQEIVKFMLTALQDSDTGASSSLSCGSSGSA